MTATATRIADLLADGQARTARDIATAIGAGYSTVGKALAVMATEGRAVKADGTWTLAQTDADTEAAAWLDARHAEAQPVDEAADIDRDAAVEATRELAVVDPAVAAHVATMRRAAAAEGRAMGTTGQYRTENRGGRELWVYVGRDEYAAILDEDAAEASGKAPRETKLPLKARGDLRADVLAWLTENAGTEITPAKLARIMGGRSSGAILKGLNRLVADGHAVQTSAAPRTFRLA